MKLVRIAACLAFAASVIVGCKPTIVVTMRTRVAESGATTRETKLERVGGDDKKDAANRQIRDAFPPGFGDLFPQRAETANAITLGGSFASPEAIPADFARAVEVVGGVSRNRISFKKADILFGTHYLYRERFSDAIEPEDLGAARDALIDQCVRFVRGAARHEFGREWNLESFDGWVKKDVRPLLVDLMEIWYSEQRNFDRKDPHTGKTGFDRAVTRARARLERAGVTLDEDLNAPLNRLLIEAWLSDQLALHLTKKTTGARAKAEDFKYLFPEPPLAAEWSGLARVTEATAVQEYGSVDAAKASFEKSFLAVTGTYGIADHNYRFDCAVEMPGTLLRTNGNVEGDSSAFFVFEGNDLFPRGVTLELESVVLDTALCARIRELRTDLTARDAAWIIRFLEDDDAAKRAELRAAIERCASYGSVKWFEDPSAADYANRESVRQRLEPIFELLAKK
jgi:hypothetical protein